MIYYLVKILVSAGIILAASEIAKRTTFFGALLLSLPLTSVLAFSWIYLETQDVEKLSKLSWSTLGMVIPSLTLFILLPTLLKFKINFWAALSLSCLGTAGAYFLFTVLLAKKGFKL